MKLCEHLEKLIRGIVNRLCSVLKWLFKNRCGTLYWSFKVLESGKSFQVMVPERVVSVEEISFIGYLVLMRAYLCHKRTKAAFSSCRYLETCACNKLSLVVGNCNHNLTIVCSIEYRELNCTVEPCYTLCTVCLYYNLPKNTLSARLSGPNCKTHEQNLYTKCEKPEEDIRVRYALS